MLLALLFFAAHLPYLPPSLEDLDSVNFAAGVQHFDVSRHQPHPPGYPVFIAMSKVSTALARAAGVGHPEVRGLAIWSAIGGALSVVFAGVFFAAVARVDGIGLLTAFLMACAPLFWFTALRPLSDTLGLAAAFAALAMIAAALRAPELKVGSDDNSRSGMLIAGAFVAGLAIGIRAQSFLLTVPLLGYALVVHRVAQARIRGIVALLIGGLAWFVPLVVVSGGPFAYLKALGSQGAEDFSGVVMLWTHHTPRIAAYALLDTFVLPWDSLVLAVVVLALATAGAAILLWRAPRAALVLALVFVPYAIFQLLFHEIVTIRYALPLVPTVAFLAVFALAGIHEHVAPVGAVLLGISGVVLAFPASAAYAREPAPIARLLQDMKAAAGAAPPVVAMHRREFTETRRWREWTGGVPGRLLPAPRDYEWLEATRAWRDRFTGPLWFIGDPRRTDLALIDSYGSVTTPYRWAFNGAVYVGGARPNEMDWHAYTAPGWFLEQGWALTAEVAGITERDGWGPHRRPSIGWVRRRSGDAVLLLGGRHLGGAGDAPVRVVADIDGRLALTTEVKPGSFLSTAPVPSGALTGAGTFAKLTVHAEPATAGASVSRVSLEQFDLQSRGTAMLGFDTGWQEPEYNPDTGRSWRWMSDRAVLRIANASRDVILRVAGENPRRYYRQTPSLSISAGGLPIARFSPASDFTYVVTIPAASLGAADGRVTLESDQMFIPADRERSADRRHLAIRIYSITLEER